MEHIALKAAATVATDEGIFEAVVSTESVDREKDVVSADGMVAALRKWDRPIPLAWNHSTKAEDMIGSVDPESAKNVDGQVVVSGQVDLESTVGREAWRSFKARTIGFSFGYMILKSSARKGGGRAIAELDVFEITATPTPMQPDTRVLAFKAVDEEHPTAAELKAQSREVALEIQTDGYSKQTPEPTPPEPEVDELAELKALLDEHDLAAAQTGALKAVWTAAFVNDLPDSSFLFVEDGEKDGEGKTTPRSLRHFPVKDAGGAVDMPHLRNALARIPQSNLLQAVKDRLTSMAQRMLAAASKSALEAHPESALKKRSLEAVLDVRSQGLSKRKPERVTPEPKADLPPEIDLKRQSRDLMLELLLNTKG